MAFAAITPCNYSFASPCKPFPATSCQSHEFACEDPLEYSVDVYLWKHEMQRKYFADDPLCLQLGQVTAQMRATVLQWLVAVNRQFNFTSETWCLAVSHLDRFLAAQPIHRDCLQLAGLTAFFIAAKVEEVDPPEISELVSLCARSYDLRQFRWMEYIMLTQLDFELLAPTPAYFLGHLVEMEQLGSCWPHWFSRHLVERSLCEYELAQTLPSHLAHAIFCVVGDQLAHDTRIQNDKFSAEACGEELVNEYMKRVSLTLQTNPGLKWGMALQRRC